MHRSASPSTLRSAITSLLVGVAASAVSANPDLSWWSAFGSPQDNDEYRDMAVAPDGTAYVTGMNALGSPGDIVTVAFDTAGDQLWSATYNGPAGGQDVAQAIAVDAAGDVYVVGRAMTATSSSDYVTVKYRGTDGTQLWVRLHDGDNSIDEARDVTVDTAGNAVVTGTVWSSNDGSDIETVKYDAAGNLLWTARYTGPGSPPFANDRGVALVVDPSGDVIVTGTSEAAIADYITIKYDGVDGAQHWASRYVGIGMADWVAAIAVDPAGDVYVTGQSYQPQELFATVCYRGTDGVQRWANVDDPGVHERPEAITVFGEGVFITGISDPDGDESNNNDDAYTARYRRSDGVTEWSARHGETGNGDYDGAHTLVHDGANNLYVAGRTNSFGADSALMLLRYDQATGAEEERVTFAEPFTGFHTAFNSVITPDGRLILGGITTGSGNDRDYLVIDFAIPAPADLDGDGTVGFGDLVIVLASWGKCAGACAADLDGDGIVGFGDLLFVLAAWS